MAVINLLTSWNYTTANFMNIEIVDWEMQGNPAPNIPLNITPLPTETETVFWQRAQTEINLALQNEFWYKETILFGAPVNVGASTTVQVINFENYQTKSIVIRQFANFVDSTPGIAQNLSINFAYSTGDLSAATTTSYNNEIARSQDDVPPLI